MVIAKSANSECIDGSLLTDERPQSFGYDFEVKGNITFTYRGALKDAFMAHLCSPFLFIIKELVKRTQFASSDSDICRIGHIKSQLFLTDNSPVTETIGTFTHMSPQLKVQPLISIIGSIYPFTTSDSYTTALYIFDPYRSGTKLEKELINRGFNNTDEDIVTDEIRLLSNKRDIYKKIIVNRNHLIQTSIIGHKLSHISSQSYIYSLEGLYDVIETGIHDKFVSVIMERAAKFFANPDEEMIDEIDYEFDEYVVKWRPALGPYLMAITQIYAKDSFDRFGDDLVRLLLSYHSYDEEFDGFESRSRHECVSKQFQRCIYDTIYELDIDDDMIDRFKAQDPVLSAKHLFYKLIKFLQRKCPKIQIVWHFNETDDYYGRQILQVMYRLANDWPQLKCLQFRDLLLEKQVFQILSPFGSMVSYLVIDSPQVIPNEEYFPNVSQLVITTFDLMFTVNDNHFMRFNGLKKFEFIWTESEYNYNRFAVFVDYYGSRLQCIRVNVTDISDDSKPKILQFLTQLSQFRELKELDIDFDDCFEYSLHQNLKTIGLNPIKGHGFESRDNELHSIHAAFKTSSSVAQSKR
ncbi:unnamed protein product [Medioppia subpectinata]|uniref:Uncharacterized protein n=1 Tax=Medioppia subpectinata TaxID=1979941 RepID=A0A7R9KG80_9ACAR|nr:unnamed protein product [Medioppia subpectinata]CAG2101762.1 unnamed protein product [Medioppia subpectinata]